MENLAETFTVGDYKLVLGGWYQHDQYPNMLVQVVLPHQPTGDDVPMGLLYHRSEVFGDLWAVRHVGLDADDARMMRRVQR